MLRFIVILMFVSGVMAQEPSTNDAEIIKNVKEFAQDINSKLPINAALEQPPHQQE